VELVTIGLFSINSGQISTNNGQTHERVTAKKIDKTTNEIVNYAYDERGDLMAGATGVSAQVKSTADGLGRVYAQETPIAGENFWFLRRGEHETAIVSSHRQRITGFPETTTEYKYDDFGNIKGIQSGTGMILGRYEYDGFNRLIRDGETAIKYDANGNITQKGDVKYTYTRDKMMSFGGETCTYDTLGNPTKYRNRTLKWDLRNLVKYDNITFKYNADDLRYEKVNDNWRTSYTWANGRLVGEHREHNYIDDIQYIHGADGIAGFKLTRDGGAPRTFWYVKNIQNDITAIFEKAASPAPVLVARYKYNAYGECTVTNTTYEKFGDQNPFRYRGYYFDTDIKKYYLKSRWYDPEVGRFLNMDDLGVIKKTRECVSGLNLYIYANNNPVMNADDDGYLFKKLWKSVGNAVNFVANSFATVISAGENIISNIIGAGTNAVESAFNTITEIAGAVTSTITGGILPIANVGGGIGNGDNSPAPVFSGQMWQDIGNSVRKFFANDIPNLFSNVASGAADIAYNIESGFWNTIGFLNDNFGATLEVLSYVSALVYLGLVWSPLATPVLLISGLAFFITIMDYFRPDGGHWL
jgi:RHS repeat-associated protein